MTKSHQVNERSEKYMYVYIYIDIYLFRRTCVIMYALFPGDTKFPPVPPGQLAAGLLAAMPAASPGPPAVPPVQLAAAMRPDAQPAVQLAVPPAPPV